MKKLVILILLLIVQACVSSNSTPGFVDGVIKSSLRTFDGCSSIEAIDSSRIKIDYLIPPEASEFIIYRNGSKVASFVDSAGSGTFIDTDLVEGIQYNYRCEAKILGKAQEGTKKVSAYTVGVNTPTFQGITSATALDASKLQVNWMPSGSNNPAVSYYNIFLSPGTSVDFTKAQSTSKIGTLSSTLSGLGDELTYSVAVRACTIQNFCDNNTVTKSITTQDTGAPKSGKITSVRPGPNNSLILTAPWKDTDGGLKIRRLYKKEGGLPSSVLSEYTLAQTFTVQDSQGSSPITELSIYNITENTKYYFVVIDEDPQGNKSVPVFGTEYLTSDLTPPVFAGVLSLMRGTPENKKISYSFTAIESEDTSTAGAEDYLLYLNYASYPSVAKDACVSASSSTPFKIFKVSQFNKGSVVTTTGADQIDAKERMSYSICIIARDRAGNLSGPHSARSVLTKDLTTPIFGGIKSLLRVTKANSQRYLTLAWEPSISDDTSEYNIKIWKNAATFDAASDQNKKTVVVPNKDTAIYEVSNASFPLTNSDVIYAYVEACDDAKSLPITGSANNCTSLGEASKKMLTLSDSIEPPGNFAGIIKAETHPTDEGSLNVFWETIDGGNTFGSGCAGFNIYEVDPTTLGTSKIATCPCVNGACPKTCTVSGLLARKTYFLKVEAYNAGGLETSSPLTQDLGYKSARTIDSSRPNFNSAISSVDNGMRKDISFTPATDNQFGDERSWTSGVTIPLYNARSYDAEINYDIYRKSGTSFIMATEPFSDPGATLLSTQPKRSRSLGNLDSSSKIIVSDLAQSDGVTYYYTVCARDSSFISSLPLKNRNCDGQVISFTLPDITKPVVKKISDTKTTSDIKSWNLSFSIKDNTTNNNLLLSSLRVYRRTSDYPSTATASDTELIQDDLSDIGYKLLFGQDNRTATNSELIVTLAGLRGPKLVNKYVSYLITVSDLRNNMQTLAINLQYPSDNRLVGDILGRSEFLKSGNEKVLIKGSGFSYGALNAMNEDTKVRIGVDLCTDIRVINSNYLECRTPFLNSNGNTTLTISNPDGTTVSKSITITDGSNNTSTLCDDVPASSRRPSSFSTAPAARSSNSLSSNLGGEQMPYILCSYSDLVAARDYNLFANRYTFLELGNHVDLTSLPMNKTFGILQGANYSSSAIDLTTPPKLNGKNYAFFNYSPKLSASTLPSAADSIIDLGIHSWGNHYAFYPRGYGLFSAVLGNMIVQDINFISPKADLTILAATGTSASSPSLSFGFLGGILSSCNSSGTLSDVNSGTASINDANFCANSASNGTKSVIKNVNVIEGSVVMTTSGQFPSVTNNSQSTVSVGGLFGANLNVNGGTGGTFSASRKGSSTILNSISQIDVSFSSNSYLPSGSKLGGMAGIFSGRILDSTSRLKLVSAPHPGSSQQAPAATSGVGGLVGDYRVPVHSCLSTSGESSAYSISSSNYSYCGLLRNSVAVDITAPTFSNIGGLWGVMVNTLNTSDNSLGAGALPNLITQRLGVISNKISGQITCSSNCGGLWGQSIGNYRYGTPDDSTIPLLLVYKNTINLNLNGLMNLGGIGSSLGSGCWGTSCTYARATIDLNNITGEINCNPVSVTGICSNIGGLLGSYSRTRNTSFVPDSQGMGLTIQDTLVNLSINIFKAPSNSASNNTNYNLGGLFGSYRDMNHPTGLSNVIGRTISGSRISYKDSAQSNTPIASGYHWFSTSYSVEASSNSSFSKLFYYNDRYTLLTTTPTPSPLPDSFKDLDSDSDGKISGNYNGFDFMNLWSTNSDTTIPYLQGL